MLLMRLIPSNNIDKYQNSTSTKPLIIILFPDCCVAGSLFHFYREHKKYQIRRPRRVELSIIPEEEKPFAGIESTTET